jgi:3-oxoacyl-[acyl-carrier-protein] synthase I
VNVSRLALTGMGLASSLGGVIGAAAAFRAGIVRACERESLSVDLPDGNEAPVCVHAARPVMEGFEHHGLWLRLASATLADLRANWERDGRVWTTCWNDTALVVVLPTIDPERFGMTDPAPHEDCVRWFVQPLLEQLPAAPRVQVVLAVGAGGTARGLQRLAEILHAGEARYGVLLAVDSLCDRTSIEWLIGQGRLKLPGHPVGLQPGEAAACLVVESIESSSSAAPIFITGMAFESETSATAVASPVTVARAWQRCLEQVLPSPQRVVADHYLDHNGEEERALAWGHLLPQVAQRMTVEHRQTWAPAGGFGDTGAARGALGCILAARSLQRGYAKSDKALVWNFGDQGDVGLVAIGREQKE